MSTAELKQAAPPAPVSAEALLSDYHDQRCELIEGVVRMMSPGSYGHGRLAARVARILDGFVEGAGLGAVTGAETGFKIGADPDTVLAPDAAFVRKDRAGAVGSFDKFFPEAPSLAVEVVSPGDSAEQVDDKARRWLAAGSELVWVVYPKGQTVTAYRALDDIEILGGDQLLKGGGVLPGFSLKVSDLFAGLDTP